MSCENLFLDKAIFNTIRHSAKFVKVYEVQTQSAQYFMIVM